MFHRVFHTTAYHWGTPTACPMVNRRAKRSPDSRGYCQGYGAGGRSGVGSVYTPAEPTIPLYRRYRYPSIGTEIIFFFHKISRYLTKFIFNTHNGFVPGPKWQGKSTFIVHVNQSSETKGPHVHFLLHIYGKTMNLLPQQRKKRELSDQQQAFLTALFENGGNFSRACEVSGYSQGSIGHLKESLADEIIEGARNILAGGALKAANKLVSTIDAPEIERGDNIRLQAAESLLNRVGLGKQETHNVNVQAIHGVVLLPPKKEMVVEIDGNA